MSGGRKVLFAVSFFVVDLLLIINIFFINNITSRHVLTQEINSLIEFDFTSNSYNLEVKTNGDCAIVEQAIKKYVTDYAKMMQSCLSIWEDDELNALLEANNYYEDGPYFEHSLQYLDAIRSSFNSEVDLLINKANYTDISKYIYNYSSDSKIVKLYNSVLNKSEIISKMYNNQAFLVSEKIKFNNYIDLVYDVLTLLKANPTQYTIIDGEIVFFDVLVEQEYYQLIS